MSRTQTQGRTTSSVNRTNHRSFEKSHYAMDWARLIRFTAPTIGLTAILSSLVALTLGAGCASKGLDAPTGNAPTAGTDAPRSAALDVRPISTGSTSSPQAGSTSSPQAGSTSSPQAGSTSSPQATSGQTYLPPSQPPAYAPPDLSPASDPVITQAPGASADSGLTAGGTTYTVQHGDTLFRIAKEHYGSGKQWTRIASANPCLTPAKLRAGQKIILP